MKILKRALMLIICFLMLFSIVSCSNSSIAETESIKDTGAEELVEETKEKDTKIIDDLEEEKKYWASQPLDVSEDGSTCFVLDYYGGVLDKKYLKFKKLDFSKNHGKHIKSVRNMFSGIDKYEDKYKIFYTYNTEHKEDEFIVSDDLSYFDSAYKNGNNNYADY